MSDDSQRRKAVKVLAGYLPATSPEITAATTEVVSLIRAEQRALLTDLINHHTVSASFNQDYWKRYVSVEDIEKMIKRLEEPQA